MSLVKSYCKEISRELGKIPVYLPGAPVQIGDIIEFGIDGQKRKPIGTFKHVSDLKSLGVHYDVREDRHPDPYKYASKGGVEISFNADAQAGDLGKGELKIAFKKEASIYLAAVDCTENLITDLTVLKEQLKPHIDKYDWKNCFIVTALMSAKKALIMQSNSTNASLVITGEVKGLNPGDSGLKVDSGIDLKVNSYKDSSFIKDWSDDVSVFFTLATFSKMATGKGFWNRKNTDSKIQNGELFILKEVSPDDL